MAAMIVVENPGNRHGFHQLEHTAQGSPLTFTDFIFPAFLFAVGMSVYCVTNRARVNGVPRQKVLRRILQRGATLFALGVLLYMFPFFRPADIQLHGVLQRIALVFAACALLGAYLRPKSYAWLTAALLAGYWVLLKFVPVPFDGVFRLPDMEQNIAKWLDERVFGRPAPEGIFSTLPAIATGLMGMIAAEKLLRHGQDGRAARLFLFRTGTVMIVAGLCWGAFFHPPANSIFFFSIEKDLWTSSYALYTGGACMVFFGIVSQLTDGWRLTRWTPAFLTFGLNSLLAYILSHMLSAVLYAITLADGRSLHRFLMQEVFERAFTLPVASLFFSLVNLLIWWAVMWALYKKKIFLKI